MMPHVTQRLRVAALAGLAASLPWLAPLAPPALAQGAATAPPASEMFGRPAVSAPLQLPAGFTDTVVAYQP